MTPRRVQLVRSTCRPGPVALLGTTCLGGLLALGGCGRDVSADGPDAARSEAAPRTAPVAPPDQAQVVPVADVAPKPTRPIDLGAGCVTSECHASFTTASYIHGVVRARDCGVCHEPDRGTHVFPLKHQGNDLCTFCHPAGGERVHQHEAMDGRGCLSCHQPHVSDVKFLLTASSVEEVCRQCHPVERRDHLHAPFGGGECTACHEPHASDFRQLLRGGEGADHCFGCHTETRSAMAKATHLHAPAADSCLICHNPHSSPHEHLLGQPIHERCFSCHKDLEEQVTGSSAPHGAVFTADQCANCHDSHASGRPLLLKDRQDALCLKCHDREVPASDGRVLASLEDLLGNREFLHGPVAAGQCSACHNVHGASHSRLLREKFTSAFYESFDLGNYALCFNCHASELVLTEQTTTLTDFRDDDVNLHFVHVNRERKGRTCRACHEIHGSNLPSHLAENVPFEGSQWTMPLRFEKTTDGGRCAPGCHEPSTYSRLRRSDSATQAPNGGAP